MREITVQVVLKLHDEHPLRREPVTAARVEDLLKSAAWLLVRDSKNERTSACVIMDREVE